jgi:hypothetical protein
MYRRIMAILLLAVVVGWSASSVRAQAADVPPQVDELSKKFFEIADGGQLKQTYELLAPLVKAIDTPDLWYGHMVSERESMGEAKNRTLLRTETVEKFADLPTGEYLELVFKTEFSKHGDSEEILVFHQGDNSEYGLVGYKVEYNRWPEALKLIGNGLFLVFFIMGLLAVMTWGVGRVVQMTNKKKPAETEKKG